MLRLQTSSQVLRRKSSLICLVWIVGVATASAQSPTITQSTQGWCSPAVGQAGGNVTIICQGVSPKALERLNELLDKKDLELQAKIQEAETWAKKYRELQERLTKEGQDDVLARTAKELLDEGKLEEAGAILDRLLASGEQRVEQVAADHFNRA
jgi:predicted Zn-dependent peptidase